MNTSIQETQVFREERHCRKFRPDGLEERQARPFFPFPEACIVCSCRNAPIVVEGAEMVDSHDVEQLQLSFQAFEPPGKTILLVHGPIVERIAPTLAFGSKIVRWHAGNARRQGIFAQLEKLRSRPDIGAIGSRVNREVPNNSQPEVVCLPSQSVPLTEENVLKELLMLNGFSERFVEPLFIGGVEGALLDWPCPPRLTVMGFLQGLEKAVRP